MTARASTRAACALALLAWALAPSAALAQSAAVTAMLQDGVALRQQGRDAEAHARFVEAWQREPLPVCAGQRAFAAQALGRWTEADRFVRAALDAPDDDWVRRHRAALERARAAIAGHIGLVEIVGGAAGTEVRFDGELAGTLPLAEPLRARAGTLLMELRAAGRHSSARRLTVEPGVVTREPGDLAPNDPPPAEPAPTPTPVPTPPVVVAAPTPAPAPPPSPPHYFAARWVVWTFAGGAVAGLALGGVGLGLRESAAQSFNDQCDPTAALDADCAGLQRRGGRRRRARGHGRGARRGARRHRRGALAAPRRRQRRARGLRGAPGPGSVVCAVAF